MPTPLEVLQNKHGKWQNRRDNLAAQIADLITQRDTLQGQIGVLQGKINRLDQGLAALDALIDEENAGTG
jgi:predicted  nucleic acid-binding Zn-ribbon protein